MIRPLSYLPRSWRLSHAEEATIEGLIGPASRRLKVRRNLERYGLGKNDEALELTIATLDSVRRRRP